MIDPNILQWASGREEDYLKAYLNTNSSRQAAKLMGVNCSTIIRAVDRVKQRAVRAGYVPQHGLTNPVPAPLVLDRMTIQTNPRTGELERTWLKAKIDQNEFVHSVEEAIKVFLEQCEPIDVPPAPSREYDRDIIPWIQIGDAHFGMLAHASETGRSFDLKVAQQELCAAWDILLEDIRPCERIVINDLGDFTHYENMAGVTEASGHSLDYDTRFPRMINVYSATMRWLVERCLEKAQHVDVIVNQGNHSRTNDMWMAELLRVCYSHTGRVHVLNNDNVFIAYRMGKTLVMVHHSDQCPPNRLVGVMVSDFTRDFGETDFHYIDIGHVHHRMVAKEHPSITVESFNNLAPMDKWAHDKGFRSKSSISVVYRSRSYGEVGRRLLPIQEVWDRLRHLGKAVVPFEKRAFSV